MQPATLPTPYIPDVRLTCNGGWVLLSLLLNTSESSILDRLPHDKWMHNQCSYLCSLRIVVPCVGRCDVVWCCMTWVCVQSVVLLQTPFA
jgi:hypothetical protein